MNRSILIVMLDFIVLSLLSMITGLSTLENPYGNDGTVVNTKTAQVIADKLKNEKSMLEEAYLDLKAAQDKFGYSQARSEAMQKLEAQLAATDLQLEILQKKDIENVDVKESRSLTNEAATLPSKYRSAMSKISSSSGGGSSDGNILDAFEFGEPGNLNFNALKDTKRILGFAAVEAEEQAKAEEKINSEELQKLQDTIRAKDLELIAVNKSLKLKEEDIKLLQSEKAVLIKDVQQKDVQIGELKETVHRKDKVILANQQQIRLSQKKLENKTKEVGVRVEEIQSTRKVLTRAITDLSKTRVVAENAKKEAAEVKEKLVTVNEDLKQLRKRIEGNVLDYYDTTVQNIRIYMEQERFWSNRRAVQSLFLPVIRLENKPVVISLFRLLAPNPAGEEAELEKVLQYVCKAYSPAGDDLHGESVTGYLTIPRKDIRVGCLELENYKGKTLSFLTFSDIKRRGLQNMYLFKANSFGHDGGSLEGRCSLSLKENDEYLYIRNALETSSEAMAEEGDLVMTKEGGFVGIVVSVTRFENGRSEAKCFVFPDAFRLRNSIRIAIDKNEKSKYLSDFDTIGGKLLPRLKKLEQLR